jgi:hypothetical protein
MGVTGEVVALLMQMSAELTKPETEWHAHVDLVNARLFNSPEKPFFNASTTIPKGLAYLDSEVSYINLRSQVTARWGFHDEDGNARTFSLPKPLGEFAVKRMGPESHVWRLKRTMAEVETFLEGLSAVLEQMEVQVSAKLKVFHMFLKIYAKLADEEGFLKCCVWSEQAERGYLLDGDDDKFAWEIVEIDRAWRNPDGHGPQKESQGFLILIATFIREALEWAGCLANHRVRLQRQTQITEFFYLAGEN